MVETYYVEARSGESWEGKTFHGSAECADLDGSARPISATVVSEAIDDATLCSCVPLDSAGGEISETSESASDSAESDSSSGEGDSSEGENADEDAASVREDGTFDDVLPEEEILQGMIDRGECPWCDGYDGDYVGRHASSAHPDEWDAFKSDA